MMLPRLIGATALVTLGLAAGPAYGDLPLVFEANIGQTDTDVKFLARSRDVTVFLTSDGALIRRGTRLVRMTLAGANRAARLRGRRAQPGQAHYFIGAPGNWRTGVPLYAEVEYTDIYPGVNLIFYGNAGELEYDFVFAPGVAPEVVRLAFEGMDGLELADGDLVLHTAAGQLRHRRPRIHQEAGGRKVEIDGGYQLFGDREAGFAVAPFDRHRALVVDPVLSYSTRVGGAGDDRAWAIAVDSAGCAYITGESWPVSFPETRLGAGATGNQDVFVTKLNPAGTGVLYSAYLGGSSRDSGRAIAVDAAGNAYVAGFTYSPDFPATAGAYRTVPAGMEDAFVFKLHPSGASLVYSTLLGGAGSDFASGIAVDAGNAYVTGYTSSLAFPTTAGAAQRTHGGGGYDAFVAKLNPAASALVWSTYIGGSGLDVSNAIAVDAGGFVYLAGSTGSGNFPVRNAYKGTISGSQDAFVAKLNPAGDAFSYATYLGGAGSDTASGIAVDAAGNAYVTGSTYSTDFSVTAGAFESTNRGGYDAFVAKLNSSGSALVYSTYLGGAGSEQATAIAVDGAGRAYVAGYTDSMDFPVQQAAQATFAGTRDAFVAALNEAGTALNQSTYLGGAGDDQAFGIAVDALGAVYVTGLTLSADFPVTAGAWRPAPIGSVDALVAKLAGPNQQPSAVSVSPSSGSGSSQVFTFVYSAPLGYADLGYVQAIFNSSLNPAGACYLHYNRPLNLIDLINDTATGAVGPAAMGGGGTLQNSQCLVQAGQSSVSFSGNTMTLRLAATFQSGFAGAKSLFLRAVDARGLDSGWQNLGTWTVTAAPLSAPTTVSVSPSSGSGSSQVFTFVYLAPGGYADLSYVQAIFNSGLNPAGACYLHYNRPLNLIDLINDPATGAVGPAAMGGGGTLQNSQCLVQAGQSSVSFSGNTITLRLAVTFQPGFAGAKSVFLRAVDTRGLESGWQNLGTWTAVAAPLSTPVAVSVSPSSGSGTSRVFTFVYSAPGGYADLSYVQAIFNSSLNPAGACYLHYNRPLNLIDLFNDTATGAVGPATMGGGGTLRNSRCLVQAGQSSVSFSGNTMTLRLAVTFLAPFAGPMNIYLRAVDGRGLDSGWQNRGTWTVP